jgi:hypothetical protein
MRGMCRFPLELIGRTAIRNLDQELRSAKIIGKLRKLCFEYFKNIVDCIFEVQSFLKHFQQVLAMSIHANSVTLT